MMPRPWIIAAVVSAGTHAALAAWLETAEPTPRPKRPAIEMQLTAPPRLAPAPPPPSPPPAVPPPKPVVARHAAPHRPSAPPPPSVTPPPAAPSPPSQKIGITDAPAADGIAVATGTSLEGEVGTGTVDTPAPPAPPAPPPPPARSTGKHYWPAYKVTRLPKPRTPIAPVLPDAFRSAQREQHVVIEVDIDETGHVVNARVVGSAEYGLGEASLAAVRRTEFEPALVEAQPVPIHYTIPLTFRVRG
jgi:protein TonB